MLNNVDLVTGPPGGAFALTPNTMFTTTALFDLTVPQAGGFYQLELSERVPSNFGMGDVLSVQVDTCNPTVDTCTPGSHRVLLANVDFATGTGETIGLFPLDTSNQQIFLELSHSVAGDPTVYGYYAYVNGGVEGPLVPLGSFAGLFDNLSYTQAGFTQVLQLPVPMPEPSTLLLLTSSIAAVAGVVWFGRRMTPRSHEWRG